ncbi:aminotransferase class V-fold PLP-dependent enzyme [Enterovibrio sp. ZSDZ42]|uniref:Aminotransferase class V-fold PLP-dependent enzyme n=1 Tax=Enterovibrio gelatinilyticus TaxID=2899819 RepID=A0ABT5R3A1_9GAMM|nr:aminotransferase class V-fold PLP-dependent enzyme [Enterovibrio sp. ZSDZ42]MDD1794246.1 aminotransferase class V-fold PLP-dependent enzyme [Enterovibrio sp. ZSDZ42]
MRISAPIVESLDTILPDEPLLMMGAGPVPIPAKVAAANGIVINHLGETMSRIIEQVKAMSRYVFQTESSHILGVAGPGSAAMEMAIANLVAPGDNVLSVCNGFFSNRLSEMSSRVEGNVTRLIIEEGQAADPIHVAKAIAEHAPKVLTIVQGETSNTVCNGALPDICRAAKAAGCLVIVDAVCTLSTMPLYMDEWGVDAVITGGQKGLSCIPGVSLVAFSEDAWDKITARQDTLRHWCLDAKLADQFWYQSSYHYTAPVSGIMAIHEALRLVCEETLPRRFDRHLRCSLALQAGIEGLGLSLFADKPSRLNSVVGINVPNGLDQKAILTRISHDFKVEISGSFGLNIIRVGQMGEQCRVHNIFRTIHALGSTIQGLNSEADLPRGVAMLEKALQEYQPQFV